MKLRNTVTECGFYDLLMLQTVALSQLDSLRRELIACARDRLEFLVFTKVLNQLCLMMIGQGECQLNAYLLAGCGEGSPDLCGSQLW